ncbi:uncharacterized protein [Spinacia oleracea]|uniref:Myb/SANT-like domain-containing protein n=1 Tax=Spinacia oleracea TaxID=3562 RepID=A0ABM3R4N5_SPIOL|nr:uncharacterized protein LOC130465739 [Spinacia oleracea]
MVDEEIKERLWVCIKKLFLCDDNKKEFVLRDCNKRWKDFKTRLTSAYFNKCTKNEVDNPPWKEYAGIDEEDWKVFKEQRESDEFKVTSERNRANQAKNLYPHHLGRGGYGKLEERFVQEQLKKAMLSGASSSKGVESE